MLEVSMNLCVFAFKIILPLSRKLILVEAHELKKQPQNYFVFLLDFAVAVATVSVTYSIIRYKKYIGQG